MQSKWKKIGSWNVGSDDGSAEVYSLYENEETGGFRIQNDFGNITIDMERMSAREFMKRASEEIDNAIDGHLYDDDWFASTDLDDDSLDCDSTGK